MIETMLSKKELNFNDLEKEIFRIGCEYAAGLMSQLLGVMDGHLENDRDKKQYRHKGKRLTSLKTLMGEVSYERMVYETRLENGETAFVYLLDEALRRWVKNFPRLKKRIPYWQRLIRAGAILSRQSSLRKQMVYGSTCRGKTGPKGRENAR